MRYLVTGGTGFIGSHLIEELVRHGEVTVLDCVDHYGFIPEDLHDRIECKVLDLGDPGSCDGLDSFDAVYHLAAISHPGKAESAPDLVNRVNVEGTRTICEFVARKGGHLVFTSTGYVYGDIKYSPIDEKHPVLPKNVYGRSKAEAEKVIQKYIDEKKIKATVIRMFNIYGPRQSKDFVIPTIINKVLEKRELRLGNPEPVRAFTYIKDICDCFYQISENESAAGNIYNLGTDTGIKIKDLVSMILKLMGSEVEPVYDPDLFRKNEIMELVVDNTRISRDIGWKPGTSLEDGLKRTIDYYGDMVI
jgi:nucleoside-diphosphate-sugar epimerase